jgi:hypothetical protein
MDEERPPLTGKEAVEKRKTMQIGGCIDFDMFVEDENPFTAEDMREIYSVGNLASVIKDYIISKLNREG